ncbi:TonB-dependent receptor [Phenylobacterium sp.]|jgi:iron complex outermembrane receptor protein|uniref:TonB-dependent receptor n=1 Tax=Phenylobacterium sp. TaxID=1871053 RepID=UPI002F3FC40C
MSNRNFWRLGASWMVLVACAAPALARAADATPDAGAAAGAVEEVVVTAQKRAENIQDVPLSIMAASSKQMEAKGVQSAVDLERIMPNLRFDSIAQASGIAVRIRGFGASSNAAIDPSVAPYIDGVYIPRPGAILSSFLDVEGVEVLRGPQGTLFGRNATVGAVSLHTYAPSTSGFSARVAAQAANYGSYQGEGMVNMPVTQDFAVRVAALANTTDGFIKNQLDGHTYGKNSTAEGRLSAKWTPTADLTWIGRVDYAHTSGDGVLINQVDTSTATAGQIAAYTARLGGNPTTLSFPPSFHTNQKFDNLNLSDRQWGVSSDLNWSFAGGYTLRLIDSYRDWQNEQSDGDVVFTTRDILNRDASFASKAQSHELQLISPKGLLDGKLDFVAGLYYFDEDYHITERFNLGSQYCSFVIGAAAPGLVGACNAFPKLGAANGAFEQTAKSYAGYVQANYALTKDLSLILGARETHDDKSGSFVETLTNPTAAPVRAAENTPNLSFKDSQPNWRASLNYQVAPAVTTFLTYSTGYKSGGLNSAGGAQALGAKRLFNSETSTDWEAGMKSTWLDHRLLLNVTAYRTELDNFQDRSFDGVSFIVRNAGSVRAQGLEFEGQFRPEQHVSVDFAAAYLDSKFTDNKNAPGLPACTGAATSCPMTQDLTGRTTTFAPKWQGNFGAQYETDPLFGGFTLALRGDVNFNSGMYTTNDLNPQGWTDGSTLWGGRATLTSQDRSLTLALFGENLTDEHDFRTKFPQVLDSVFGVRIPSTGATLMRGFMNTPRTFGLRVTKTY